MSARLSFAAAVAAQRRLFFLRIRRRSSLWIATALCALPPLLALFVAIFRGGGRNTFTESMELELVLLPFLPLLFATTLLGDELERHTSDFILARPVARATLVLGRLSALWPVGVAAVIGALLAFVAAYAPQLSDAPAQIPTLGAALVATAFGFAAYAALAILFSVLFPRHTVVALGAYIVVIELGASGLPIALQWTALLWHLRNLADVPRAAAAGWAPAVPPWLSALVVAVAAVAATLYAIRRLNRAEPPGL